MTSKAKLLFAAVLLAFAGTASAVTYDIQDGNIISISNLELIFDDSSPMDSGLYNISFVNDVGVDQYGGPEDPAWDFMLPEDGVAAMAQIIAAVNAAPENVLRASAAGSFEFFIPLVETFIPFPIQATVWGAVGAEPISSGSGIWDLCTEDCLAGVRPLGPEDVNTFARVALVPVPAAVWLFASALGLLGWIRRKAT